MYITDKYKDKYHENQDVPCRKRRDRIVWLLTGLSSIDCRSYNKVTFYLLVSCDFFIFDTYSIFANRGEKEKKEQ